MKDLIGNKLEAGNLVLWNNFIAKVKEVHEGLTVIEKGRSQSEPTYVVLELKLATQRPGEPAQVMRIVDPASEELLSSIAAGVS